MAIQNQYLTADGDINQAKRKRAGEAMAIDAVPKQNSFDVTNTPSAMLGTRNAQAAVDAAMQVGAVRNGQPAVAPGYSSFTPVRDLQRAADGREQRNAIAQAETAQRGLLGEAVTTDAGQQAIKTALAPAIPAVVPGNPERAARMQAQFDQPVTKGGAAAPSPVAAGIPAPGSETRGAFGTGLQGAAEAGIGALAYIPSAVYDGVRNLAGSVSGGDTSQIKQYRGGAADVFSDGIDKMSEGAAALRESSATGVRGALGIDKRAQSGDLAPVDRGNNPYIGQQFDQWAQQQEPAGQASPSQAQAPSVTAKPNGGGYTSTGIGAGQQGGQIVMRQGENGAPEFSNDPAAQAGAQVMPAAGMGSPLLNPGVSNMADDVALEKRGSINNVGNGIGGVSFGQAGDSAMALGRFERANQERAKMAQISRQGVIGEGGGQLTVVSDSARTPSLQERKLARLDNRQAQTDALRARTQQGIMTGSDKLLTSQLERQKIQQDIQAGDAGLQDRQRLQRLYSQYEQAAQADRPALAEQIRVLTGAKQDNPYGVARGGQEFDVTANTLINRPDVLYNKRTGEIAGNADRATQLNSDIAQARRVVASDPGKRAEIEKRLQQAYGRGLDG